MESPYSYYAEWLVRSQINGRGGRSFEGKKKSSTDPGEREKLNKDGSAKITVERTGRVVTNDHQLLS